MDYFPNIDAVKYFVSDILPIVKNKFPQLKFYIVGQKPVEQVLALKNDDVIVTGFVKDLSAEYDKSSVAVSPIQYGAGTLNKVLEPMAMGIPVVSTEIGFKGLGINSGEGVLLASGKEQFANHVISLLSSEQMRRETGEKGKKVIYENFDWDKIALKLENFFLTV
jgi:glycosyltransferase involved in cell wall biosynthesis